MNENRISNVIVVGAGGVGVITALSLYKRGKSNVSLVVRSDYDHVLKHGYSINSCDYGELEDWRPHHLFKTAEQASDANIFFDYIIVTTKNIPDGPISSRVSNIIKPLLISNHKLNNAGQSNIVLVQNGIDIEHEITEAFDKTKLNYTVLSGIQFIGSTKIGHGKINQQGQDRLSVGAFDPDDIHALRAAETFVDLYNNEGFNLVEFDERVRYSRWKKLLYNAAINTTTALVGLDVPRTLEFAENKKSTEFGIYRPAMQEIMKIAQAEGIILDDQFVDFFTNITRKLIFKPSMCVDVEKCQLMELEVILGNPIRIARKYNVQTPVLSMLYNLLILTQGRIKEKKGLIKFDEETATLL